jgi:phosphate transport system substrate-binding protein
VTLPDLTITTVVRQDASGTTFAFTRHLDAVSPQWRTQHVPATIIDWPGTAIRAEGNEGVAGKIKLSIGSVGYVSHEFAQRVGLSVALLENRDGRFVAPSAESSALALSEAELPANLRVYVPDPTGADAYPIVTLTWILLHRRPADPQKAERLRDLFHWCLTDGQQYAAQDGYIPLSHQIMAAALAQLDANSQP